MFFILRILENEWTKTCIVLNAPTAMANSVKIILDNYVNNTCYPRQTLSGRVECFFDEEITVRAVRLKFKGRAKSKWSTGGKNNVTYWAEEVYFNQEYNLISGPSGADDFQLAAGRHTYPFSYILPEILPSSYEGKFGKVQYSIKATVDRPWMFDYKEKVLLNVFSSFNLNLLPGLQNPKAVSVDKQVRYGWCGCQTNPLIFNIYLPATGYAEGQDMNIGASIRNMSTVNVERVQFKIIQMIRFIAHQPRTSERYSEYPVASFTTGAIGVHPEKSWTSTITIPRSYFPNLTPCRIINTTYRVEAEVVLPFPHLNLSCYLPITIGNIPLSGTNMELQTNAYQSKSTATAPLAGFGDKV